MTGGQTILIVDITLILASACLAARGFRRIKLHLFAGSFCESFALTAGIALFGWTVVYRTLLMLAVPKIWVISCFFILLSEATLVPIRLLQISIAVLPAALISAFIVSKRFRRKKYNAIMPMGTN
jgi:hypothetical protein